MANKPFSLPSAMKSATEAVTKTWAKQRRAEERDRNAESNRLGRLTSGHSMSLKDAAADVMLEAYLAASDNGKLPVKARQIMYAARPQILKMTGKGHLDDAYFTQTLLPDYMEDHYCYDWDVVWDARGTFFEPHTKRAVPIGTIEVRQYIGERPDDNDKDKVSDNLKCITKGPENRYSSVLFIEKEGFSLLIKRAQIVERLDLAIMSTKGMSTTAARMLIDNLVDRGVEKIFVLHDFDISGFSIFGTLFTDSRRYNFMNDVPVIDIGLRLQDVKEMDLQSEPVAFGTRKSTDREIVKTKRKKTETLRRHGATDEEVAFLMGPEIVRMGGNRVELNAMTSRQFIEFLEKKLAEHGVKKIIPDNEVIIEHARRVLEHRFTEEALDDIRDEIATRAEEFELPEDLQALVEQEIKRDPSQPWDLALARVVSQLDEDGEQ